MIALYRQYLLYEILYMSSLTILTFPQKFCYFMHIRPPDDAVLVELFPVVLYEEKEVCRVTY